MKVIVVKENACYEAKNLPLGMAAPVGMICDMNPYTAKNWLIPAGVVVPATDENRRRFQEKLKTK